MTLHTSWCLETHNLCLTRHSTSQVLVLPVLSHALEEEEGTGSQVVDAALVDTIATDMLGLGQISTSQPGDGKEEGAPSGSSNDTTAHLVSSCSECLT
jgi:hypothetical protein